MTESVGRFALVLHTHLPWLAHHGRWPVGEEWLYQAIGQSYLRVLDVLDALAARGHTDVLTLGITPVLASQLDDPYCLAGARAWCADWRLRAEQLCRIDPEAGRREIAQAESALAALTGNTAHGFSGRLRRLRDADAVELLGGPATHPFQPLLDERVVDYGLRVGIEDHERRIGGRPAGIWAPECGYRPGLELTYQARGVGHFVVDGPTLLHVGADTHEPWLVGDSDVVAFARDLEVAYRVWSPRRGYPGDPAYREFHVVDELGFRTRRVTSAREHGTAKSPYDPAAAAAVVRRDALDFVGVVRDRLLALREQRPDPLIVAAYDTELFGHWWHEGPEWLGQVLTLLPEAGVEVTTLQRQAGSATGRVRPEPGSWGSGKDWRVWAGPAVREVVEDNDDLQRRWLKAVDGSPTWPDPWLDQLAAEALLALSSDWAFMISKDSAAAYARGRHRHHHDAFTRLADALETGRHDPRLLAGLRDPDSVFPGLDGRLLKAAL